MGRARSRRETEEDYERTAREYGKSLPLEHFMESTAQAFQRHIFMVAFRLICAVRPDIHPFSELLVQYRYGRPAKRRQVVPDNMVVVHPEPITALTSYNVPFQPAGPFFVLEYVSSSNPLKDYEDSPAKYEKELKVPYFLRAHPEAQEVSLFRHNGKRHVSVIPDDRGRYAIPELEVELAQLDGWVRFWFRGELLDLPEVMKQKLEAAEQRATTAEMALERSEARVAELLRQIAERNNP